MFFLSMFLIPDRWANVSSFNVFYGLLETTSQKYLLAALGAEGLLSRVRMMKCEVEISNCTGLPDMDVFEKRKQDYLIYNTFLYK